MGERDNDDDNERQRGTYAKSPLITNKFWGPRLESPRDAKFLDWLYSKWDPACARRFSVVYH